MFTILQMPRKGVNNMLSFIHTNISNVHCFAYIPLSGRKYVHFYTAIFQMYIVLHISLSRGKQYVHFYINMSNVYFFAYILASG